MCLSSPSPPPPPPPPPPMPDDSADKKAAETKANQAARRRRGLRQTVLTSGLGAPEEGAGQVQRPTVLGKAS